MEMETSLYRTQSKVPEKPCTVQSNGTVKEVLANLFVRKEKHDEENREMERRKQPGQDEGWV